MWSLGATIYTLLSGIKPFEYGPHSSSDCENPSPEQKSHQRGKILNGEYNFDDPVWEKITSQAKELISSLLKVRPSDRISSKEALEHSWITSVDIDLRSFALQWKINSRTRRGIARRERREKCITEKISPSRTGDSRSTDVSRPNTTVRSAIREKDYERPNRTERNHRTERTDRTDRLKSEPVERSNIYSSKDDKYSSRVDKYSSRVDKYSSRDDKYSSRDDRSSSASSISSSRLKDPVSPISSGSRYDSPTNSSVYSRKYR